MKQQAELGQMTGQVGQSEAIDGANPNASGLVQTSCFRQQITSTTLLK